MSWHVFYLSFFFFFIIYIESEIISGTETLEPSPESLTEETSLDSSEKSASIQKYE